MSNEHLDTQAMINIADVLSTTERDIWYQAGYEDGFNNRRNGNALSQYQGQYPLAVSDVYLTGFSAGQIAAKKNRD